MSTIIRRINPLLEQEEALVQAGHHQWESAVWVAPWVVKTSAVMLISKRPSHISASARSLYQIVRFV